MSLHTNRPSFRSLSHEIVLERVNRGSAVLNDVSKAIHARLELEEHCSDVWSKLSKINAYENEIKNSSAEIALGYLKNYYLNNSIEHKVFRKNFEADISIPIDSAKSKRFDEINKSIHSIGEAKMKAVNARTSLEKYKKALNKVLSDLGSAEGKISHLQSLIQKGESEKAHKKQYSPSVPSFFSQKSESSNKEEGGKEKVSMVSKLMSAAFEINPEQDLLKVQKKIAHYKEESDGYVIDIQMRKHALFTAIAEREKCIEHAAELFQQYESSRLLALKECLSNYCLLERRLLEAKLTNLKSVEEAVQSMNCCADLDLFISDTVSSQGYAAPHKLSNVLGILDWNNIRRNKSKEAVETDGNGRNGNASSGRPKQSDPSSFLSSSSLSTLVQKFNSVTDIHEQETEEVEELESDPVLDSNEDDTQLEQEDLSKRPVSDTTHVKVVQSPKIRRKVDSEPKLKSTPHYISVAVDAKKAEMTTIEPFLEKLTCEIFEDSMCPNNEADSIDESKVENGNTGVGCHSGDNRVSDVPLWQILNSTPFDISSPLLSRQCSDVSRLPSECNTPGISDAVFFDQRLCVEDKSELFAIPEEDGKAIGVEKLNIDGKGDVHSVFLMNRGRSLFLKELNQRRGKQSKLKEKGYLCLMNTMKIFLDCCLESFDVKNAMQLLNMANTFYLDEESCELPPKSPIANPTRSVVERYIDCRNRRYLHKENCIRQHGMWSKKGFWEKAMLVGLGNGLDNMQTNIEWDDSPEETLSDTVLEIHNLIFGQLGSLALIMHDLEMTPAQVESNILHLSKTSQLSEEQELHLLRNIKDMFALDKLAGII